MAEFLNKNIKYLRNQKGLSQSDLANKIGIDRSTISRIENNESETTIENAIKIADAFDITVNCLLNQDLTIPNNTFDETDVLFDKYKSILTSEDKETIKFLIEKRKREIDKQLGKE